MTRLLVTGGTDAGITARPARAPATAALDGSARINQYWVNEG